MKFALSLLVLFVCSTAALAQTEGQTAAATPGPKSSAPVKTVSAAEKFEAEFIPRNSKVYIGRFSEDGDGDKKEFESYLAAAMRKKGVPLLIVTTREEADFIIEGASEKRKTGWAKTIFGSGRDAASASITVTNLRTGVVAYADSSDRRDALRGHRSTAEKLAKYLKKKIEDDEKKARRWAGESRQ
ncbi:MAG: hypothetical protein JOZ96_02685 [Acidobacteria bacterium]|nr:hypothetical protein [Acidobacteriota bacterium]